jgi:MazG family protein
MTTAGARFDELIRIMRALRGPDGCPWDREQTLASLRPFLLEETYEALEALDGGDMPGLREELGDLLFEIVFLSHIAEEQGDFSIADAVDTVAQKLVRRHPHVFGDAGKLALAEEVRGKWEELKAVERKDTGEPKTLLSGVPLALPALLRAYEYSSRAATVGFDWVAARDVLDKIEEEVREIRQAVEGRVGQVSQVGRVSQVEQVGRVSQVSQIEEEMGDLLFAIANLARKLGVEPEAALRRANDKFRERFTAVETRVESRGERLQDKTLEELEAEWQAVKTQEA